MSENVDATACGLPVFLGLAAIGVTGKEMAAALRVSTASISKWRNGHAVIPDDSRVFLTLMLGDQLTRATEFEARAEGMGYDASAIECARDALTRQENLNAGLPAMAVREGARRYRLWWNAIRNAAYLKPDEQMRDLGSQIAAGFR